MNSFIEVISSGQQILVSVDSIAIIETAHDQSGTLIRFKIPANDGAHTIKVSQSYQQLKIAIRNAGGKGFNS